MTHRAIIINVVAVTAIISLAFCIASLAYLQLKHIVAGWRWIVLLLTGFLILGVSLWVIRYLSNDLQSVGHYREIKLALETGGASAVMSKFGFEAWALFAYQFLAAATFVVAALIFVMTVMVSLIRVKVVAGIAGSVSRWMEAKTASYSLTSEVMLAAILLLLSLLLANGTFYNLATRQPSVSTDDQPTPTTSST